MVWQETTLSCYRIETLISHCTSTSVILTRLRHCRAPTAERWRTCCHRPVAIQGWHPSRRNGHYISGLDAQAVSLTSQA